MMAIGGAFKVGLMVMEMTMVQVQTLPDTGHPYIGMWVTGDGHIRQELLPNGRYDEARLDSRQRITDCRDEEAFPLPAQVAYVQLAVADESFY